MSRNFDILFAGFGGQGVLFSGKIAAYAGLYDDKNITWLPSYGPEMRGGTANCSVCISDEPIGSPCVVSPNAFVALNLPSFQKFKDSVKTGGTMIADSSLIPEKCDRTDINIFYVPAAKLAAENGLDGLSNIILLGKLFKETGFCTRESLDKALVHCVPKSKQHLLEPNKRALQLGMDC